MKTGARYRVMRFAPIIGRPGTARRVTVAFQAFTFAEAFAYARHSHYRGALWIQHRDETAHRFRQRRATD